MALDIHFTDKDLLHIDKNIALNQLKIGDRMVLINGDALIPINVIRIIVPCSLKPEDHTKINIQEDLGPIG